MSSYFKNQVVVVTGATKGIGRATAIAFAREGASVVATGRTREALDSVSETIKGLGSKVVSVQADLSKEESIEKITKTALGEFGHVDVLKLVFKVNLLSSVLLTKALLPNMITRKYGKIVNISSIGGRRGGKGRSAYRMTKAALINFTESIAAEVNLHGISVNCICPGGTDTQGFRSAFNARSAEKNKYLMKPEEISDLILFLTSEKASSITGASIDAYGQTKPIFFPDPSMGKV
ncbi:MAG: SDR family oxidoreductase [Alphaproteobacteria bacterium]